jgi:hypothetical protein
VRPPVSCCARTRRFKHSFAVSWRAYGAPIARTLARLEEVHKCRSASFPSQLLAIWPCTDIIGKVKEKQQKALKNLPIIDFQEIKGLKVETAKSISEGSLLHLGFTNKLQEETTYVEFCVVESATDIIRDASYCVCITTILQ